MPPLPKPAKPLIDPKLMEEIRQLRNDFSLLLFRTESLVHRFEILEKGQRPDDEIPF